MGVDFSSLVLGPCMDAFAINVLVTPVKSQPMAAPYAARGVWNVDNINVAGEDGLAFSTRTLKIGVKLNEFPVPLAQGDFITIPVSSMPMGYAADAYSRSGTVDLVIDNDQPDGQGGTVLILKRRPV